MASKPCVVVIDVSSVWCVETAGSSEVIVEKLSVFFKNMVVGTVVFSVESETASVNRKITHGFEFALMK